MLNHKGVDMKYKASEIIANMTYGELFRTEKYVIDDSAKDDDLISLNFKVKDVNIGETTKYKESINMIPEIKKIQSANTNDGLFKFFVDGTRKTYKVSSVEYNKKVYPIMAGQITVGCCERQNKNLKALKYYHENIISLPNIAYWDHDETSKMRTEFFNNIKNEINELATFKKMNISIDHIIPYKEERYASQNIPYENLGIAAIHEMMLDREKKIVDSLVKENNLSNLENYLIKDGSIEYIDSQRGEFRKLSKIRNNYKRVVGVSKNPNPELFSSANKSTASLLAKLPEFHRSPAYKLVLEKNITHSDGEVWFIVWYVRIRKYHSYNPFDGLLKVETLMLGDNPKDDVFDSQEIDMISANLIMERFPTSYGIEARWPNHLYPIYLTEKFIKSLQINDEVFKNLF
jgi:hypothetical protein